MIVRLEGVEEGEKRILTTNYDSKFRGRFCKDFNLKEDSQFQMVKERKINEFGDRKADGREVNVGKRKEKKFIKKGAGFYLLLNIHQNVLDLIKGVGQK